MKIFKVALIAGVSVLALASAVAAGAVFYIQNNDLRGMVSWAAQRNGVTVKMDGPVSVRLFPELVVNVEKVDVAALQGEGTLASVDKAMVRVGWGSGLTPWKGFVVREVEAANPTLNLIKSKDGVANWAMKASEPADVSEVVTAPATGGGFNLPMLAATKLTVTNLNMVFDDRASAQKVVVKAMDVLANTDGTTATTRLQGTVNDQAVSGKLTVDMANYDNLPLTLQANGAGLNLAVNGRVADQKEFAGQVSAQTENLRSTLAALLGKAPAQAPADAFKLTGDVTGGAERVVLRNFNTSLGDLLKANGDVDVTLGSNPSAKGQVRIQGSNLRQLAELGTGAAQPMLPASAFTLATALDGQDAIVLKNLTFNLANLATLKGAVTVVPPSGSPLKFDADVALNASNLRSLAKAFGQAGTFPELPLASRIVVNGQGQTYTVKSFEASLADLMKATGQATVVADAQPVVDGKFMIEGGNVQSAARAFGVATANIPASPFKASASVSGKGTLKVDDLSVNLPQLVEATGKLSFTPGIPVNLTGNVDVSRLNLTALGVCSAPAPVNNAAPVAAAPAASSAASPWTNEPLDLEVLRSFATDLKVDVKGISCANFPATAASAHIANTPSQLDVKDVKISLPQNSTLQLNATLQHAGTPALTLEMFSNGLPVEELVPTLKAKGVALPLNAQAKLSSSGASTQALASNLAGTLQLDADKGRVPYVSLLGNVNNIQRLLQGQASVPDNGNGALDSFKAAYSLKNGVATTEAFALSTANGAMTLAGTGEIDIGAWAIDYVLTPKVQISNGIEIPVLVKGPLGSPSIGADPSFVSKLTGRLATEGLKGALGLEKGAAKEVGGVVGDVLSGKGLSKEGVGSLLNTFVKPPKGSVSASDAGSSGQPRQQRPLENLLNGVLNQ